MVALAILCTLLFLTLLDNTIVSFDTDTFGIHTFQYVRDKSISPVAEEKIHNEKGP